MALGGVRRSQLIATYGVGSMIPKGNASVMVAGTAFWPVQYYPGDVLHEPRLEKKLKVSCFYQPPASDKEGAHNIPVVRFPSWYWCPGCKRLDHYDALAGQIEGKCRFCGTPLNPSRFVMVCANGHIDDFPYHAWVHSSQPESPGPHQLYFESTGTSASLQDIKITCSCEAKRTMAGSFAGDALKNITPCTGRQPWLYPDGAGGRCGLVPRTLQRGASNVYFPISESALSIPPWSEGAARAIRTQLEILESVPQEALPAVVDSWRERLGIPYSTAELLAALSTLSGTSNEMLLSDPPSLREQEYDALVQGRAESDGDQDFVCVPATQLTGELGSVVSAVSEVRRLREVRALTSFARLFPPSAGDDDNRFQPLSVPRLNWLPAVQVNGEGVFIQLSTERIQDWERLDKVKARVKPIADNYAKRFQATRRQPDRVITPRLVMLHTLAHALIHEWTLDCGYPTSSLRERLYVGPEMSGILLYTAASDSAGSLGGVAALASNGRLETIFKKALWRAAWCSADPTCVESGPSGVDGLNLAACHACVLLPEVSCEEQNVLLDRALLVGTPSSPDLGYFSKIVNPFAAQGS